MKIYIDNKKAVVKKNFSIEYAQENPMLTEAEGYTLSITFPLHSCTNNVAIFGHLTRKDLDTFKAVLPCRIVLPNLTLVGAVTVTEISALEVKVQFLQGVSVRNYIKSYSPLEGLFVDELNVASMKGVLKESPSCGDYSCGASHIMLQWQDSSGVIHNNVTKKGDGWYEWVNPDEAISTFPFLLPLTQWLLEERGYTVDFTEWENDECMRNLIACNTYIGQEYFSQSLPHWTVDEYLTNIGLFLMGYFSIDDVNKHVEFHSFTPKKEYHITNVLKKYSAEKLNAGDCKYIRSSKLKYADQEHEQWKFDNCPNLIEIFHKMGRYIVRDTFSELFSEFVKWYYVQDLETPSNLVGYYGYAKDEETYFCLKCTSIGNESYNRKDFALWPINRFAPYNWDKEDVNEIDLNVVPANIPHYYLFGDVIHVKDRVNEDGILLDNFTYVNSFPQPTFAANALNGKEKTGRSYFEDLPVAVANQEFTSKFYVAAIDKFYMPSYDNSDAYIDTGVNFRLSRIEKLVPKIDDTLKYKFDFISDDFPDVNSIFYIQGKKYICEKITTNITENGMSQLKKGTFYRIID